MPDEMPNKECENPKPFLCDHCGEDLGPRAGDALLIGELILEFKESSWIGHKKCGRKTRFAVTGKKPSE